MAHDSADVGAFLFIYIYIYMFFNESGESKRPKMIQNACTTCLFLLLPFAYCAQVIKDQATGEDWCVMARRRVQLSWKGVYRPTTFINILLINYLRVAFG